MRRARRAIVAIALTSAVAGAGWIVLGTLDGPWGMLPGGAFQGPALPCEAARWEQWGDVPEVELEVRPVSPRSMTTWSVVYQGNLFVPADFLSPWKRWPHQVLEDSRVRLRIDNRIFECRAERAVDEALIGELRREAATKYDLDLDGPAARTEVWWFRMARRTE